MDAKKVERPGYNTAVSLGAWRVPLLTGLALAVVTITTDGGGVASTSVEAGSVTVTENADTFAKYLGAYVYCSEQKSGAVLIDTDAPSGTVTFAAAAGDDIVCDWYNITPAAAPPAPTSEPTTPTTPATTLPTTGIPAGRDGGNPLFGAGLVAAAAAVFAAAKKLRPDGTEPGA